MDLKKFMNRFAWSRKKGQRWLPCEPSEASSLTVFGLEEAEALEKAEVLLTENKYTENDISSVYYSEEQKRLNIRLKSE